MSDSDAFDGCVRIAIGIVAVVILLSTLLKHLDRQDNYIIDLQKRISVLEQKVK